MLSSRSTNWTADQREHYDAVLVVIRQGIGLLWRYYSCPRMRDRVKGPSECCIHIHNQCNDRVSRHWYNTMNSRPEGNYHTGDVLEPSVGVRVPGELRQNEMQCCWTVKTVGGIARDRPRLPSLSNPKTTRFQQLRIPGSSQMHHFDHSRQMIHRLMHSTKKRHIYWRLQFPFRECYRMSSVERIDRAMPKSDHP